MLAAPWVVDVLAPGFTGAKRELTIALVRILFPGAGVLVLSAWCLGVLNVHGRFFLSYAAPIAWNVAMIGTLVAFGRAVRCRTLAVYLAWGSVVGSLAQLAVQSRQAWTLSAAARLALTGPVREAVRNFGPVMASRGAVQFSAYIDTVIGACCRPAPSPALTNAQLLYTLPVSLFGISIRRRRFRRFPPTRMPATRSNGCAPRGRERAAHRVLRRALGRQLRGARRRAGGDAAADRSVHSRGLELRLGHPRGLGDRAGRIDPGRL